MKTLIAIVIPSGELIHADTACALAMNVTLLTQVGIPFVIINPKCSLVQKGRTIGVQQALDAGCSHVMFIDSDMVMPMNTIMTLFKHDKDIVGCYYPKRDGSGDWVGHFNTMQMHQFLGVSKATTLGTGMMLIKAEVFKNMPQPWFHVELNDGRWTSEDEWFCLHNDYTVYCDCDLSKHIGHIGSTTYRSN